jgi:hypothetical protein
MPGAAAALQQSTLFNIWVLLMPDMASWRCVIEVGRHPNSWQHNSGKLKRSKATVGAVLRELRV